MVAWWEGGCNWAGGWDAVSVSACVWVTELTVGLSWAVAVAGKPGAPLPLCASL